MKKFILPLILVLLTFFLYINSLSNKFTYDDRYLIVNNPHLKDFKNNIPSFFTKDYFRIANYEQSYRPIATLTYFINYQIWKLDPFGYHLFSIMLHIANVLILYTLLNKLFNNKILSFTACLFFLSHPVLTEALNNVTFNEDLLAALFLMLSFIFYIEFMHDKKRYYKGSETAHRSQVREKPAFFDCNFLKKRVFGNALNYFISLILFFAALLSKESALPFLGIILMHDIFIDEINPKKVIKNKDIIYFFNIIVKKIKTNLFIYLGFMAVTFFYLYLLFIAFSNENKLIVDSKGSLIERIIFMPYNLFIFIKLAFMPINLNSNYLFSYPDTFFNMLNITSYSALIGIIFLSFLIYNYSKKIFFGIWFFFISLATVLNIIEIYKPISERYLYLPLIGFSLIIGALLTEEFDKFKIKNNYLKQGIKFFLILSLFSFYSYNTFARNKVWKDDFTLNSDVIKKEPKSDDAYNDLGAIYFMNGMLDEAEIYYKKAITLRSDIATYYFNLGLVYIKKELFDEAIGEFNKAIQIDPSNYLSYYNLGFSYEKKGLLNEAIMQYNKSIQSFSENADSYNRLANIYFMQNRLQDAIALWEKIIIIQPNNLAAKENLAKARNLIKK